MILALTRRIVPALVGLLSSVPLAVLPTRAAAQVQLVVRDAGPGDLGRLVKDALSRPYTVIRRDTGDVVLRRDTTIDRTLIVIGRDLRLAAAVDGDVVVIGGDVFLRPGAYVVGDVIATGGAVYNSTLARVTGVRHSFRDETFRATEQPDGTIALDYEVVRVRTYAGLMLPGMFGVRIPQYDRVNGLSLAVAPIFHVDSGRFELEPGVTYRSHLGKFDPSLAARVALGRRTSLEVVAARTTRTNDAWIRGDLSNSITTFWGGRDTRNWYRADEAEGTLRRMYEVGESSVTPFVGARWERAWSTGIQSPPRHTAYSVLDRTDTLEGMRRPNPLVAEGVIASALAGFEGEWLPAGHDLVVRGDVRFEAAPQVVGDRRFSQVTLDGRVEFPLTRRIDFRLDAHAVGTVGDAPPQRYAYLGGSGTLRTRDLLSMGGDQLVYTEERVTTALPFVRLPMVGPPSLSLYHAMGAAGVGGLPELVHNLGVRLTLFGIRATFAVDPVSGDSEVGLGVSFSP